MEKVRAELTIFFVEKARALHLTSFLLSVLLETIATSQSARENLDSYCKKYIVYVRIKLQFSSYKMFVVNDTSLISSHQYSVQHFYNHFFISILFPLLPLRFHFSLISLFFNSFISHFYTSTAVDTCSLRLPIFVTS